MRVRRALRTREERIVGNDRGLNAKKERRKAFRAGSPDRFKFSEAESSQKRRLTRQVDTRDIFFQLASESRDLHSHARKGNYSART